MEARQPHSSAGEAIEIGRVNLAAKAADVREAQIICDNEQDVWSRRLLMIRHGMLSLGMRRKIKLKLS